MAIADRHGLPIAVRTASGERHETQLVIDTLRSRFIDELPERLVGDRAYDSDPLDSTLTEAGIEMISPHKQKRRKPRTQDGRVLRRYRRRWRVERLFAWILRFRRVTTRYEHKASNFLAFAKLACIVILLRQPLFLAHPT